MNSIRFSMLLAICVAFGVQNQVSADAAGVAGAAQNLVKEAAGTGTELFGKLGAYEGLAIEFLVDALKKGCVKTERLVSEHPYIATAVLVALYLKVADIMTQGEVSYELREKLRRLKKAFGTVQGKIIALLGLGAGIAIGTTYDIKAIGTFIKESFIKGAESVINA